MLRISAGFKAVALCFCFLALAACSKKNSPDLEANNGLGRAAIAGSENQFKTEVGDTVYFLVDQSTLKYRTYPAARPRQRNLLNGDIIKIFKDLRVTDSFLMKSRMREMLFRKPSRR